MDIWQESRYASVVEHPWKAALGHTIFGVLLTRKYQKVRLGLSTSLQQWTKWTSSSKNGREPLKHSKRHGCLNRPNLFKFFKGIHEFYFVHFWIQRSVKRIYGLQSLFSSIYWYTWICWPGKVWVWVLANINDIPCFHKTYCSFLLLKSKC